MAATSSFTEGSSVFGGQSNLLQAITNIFTIYDPDVIAVHTTCLSETIGDDIPQITAKARDEGKIPDGKDVIYCNTPSYVGSHVTGFSNMVEGMVKAYATKEETKNNTINLIPGWIEPCDMKEIKRLTSLFDASTIMFPDTSGVLNAPQSGSHVMYPQGGVTIDELKQVGVSKGTIAFGPTASLAAARTLDVQCNVPYELLEIPYGLKATDRFIHTFSKLTGKPVPAEIEFERGRLVDLITDTHQYLHGKRVALWGDPDQLVPLCEMLVDLDMRPVYVVTGTPGKKFLKRLDKFLSDAVPEAKVEFGHNADMFLMHQWIKNESVDLLIGNTYGKYISRDEDIPFLRHGFPIFDRIGHQYFPTVGYRGAIRLIEQMLSLFLDRKDRDSPEESFELVL